jgi:tetratricopeptide (TPR) repeat protein
MKRRWYKRMGSGFSVLAAFFVLAACSSPLSREPESPPTPTPPFARESAAIATAEAGDDTAARAAAYYERGNARFDQGDYAGAVIDYGRAIGFDQRHARAFNNRGLARVALGQPDEALKDYTQAIAIDPQYVRAYRNRLPLLEQRGDLQAVAADYARLAEIDADGAADYRYRQGSALQGLRDFAGARAAYDAALARDPEHVDALYQRALLSFAERALPAAIADLDRAIDLSPRAANAYYARGLAWGAQGDQGRAIGDFSQALALQPSYPEALLARAAAYHAASDDARARADLERLDELELDAEMQAAAAALRRQVEG